MTDICLKESEVPPEDTAAMKEIRAWRSGERKKSVESFDKLVQWAEKKALSQYTRVSERAKWIRLCGQLLWYKDQIMRGMTYEALDQDVGRILRQDFKREQESQRARALQSIVRTQIVPTIPKKNSEEEKQEDTASS